MIKKIIIGSLGLGLLTSVAFANNVNKTTENNVNKATTAAKFVFVHYLNTSNSLKTDADFINFARAFNNLFGTTKPRQIDPITWLVYNKMEGKMIITKKIIKGDNKALKEIYNKVLYHFGSFKNIKPIIGKFSKYLAYDNASKICSLFTKSGFFDHGGKYISEVDNQITGQKFKVVVASRKDCKKTFDETSKLANELVALVKKHSNQE